MCSVILLQKKSSIANSQDLPGQGIVSVLPSLKIGYEARRNWLQVAAGTISSEADRSQPYSTKSEAKNNYCAVDFYYSNCDYQQH
jgi:hypothetical protein